MIDPGIIDHGTSPYGVLVFYPQAQDSDVGGSRTSHARTPLQTSRNADRGKHPALRASLSLAGLKAGVSRGEVG